VGTGSQGCPEGVVGRAITFFGFAILNTVFRLTFFVLRKKQ
jgi:hypothetical protein